MRGGGGVRVITTDCAAFFSQKQNGFCCVSLKEDRRSGVAENNVFLREQNKYGLLSCGWMMCVCEK